MTKQNCPSCGQLISQNYCSQCGEKKHNPDKLRIRYFLAQLISAITLSDTKFLRTFKSLILNPGNISSDYMIGKRKNYTPPISMFLIANLIFFFLTPISTFDAKIEDLSKESQVSEWVENKIESISIENNQSREETISRYNIEAPKKSKLLFIILVFLLSIPLTILYFKQRPLYLAHLVYSLNLMTCLLFIIFIFLPMLIFLIVSFVEKTIFHNSLQVINFDTPVFLTSFLLLLFLIIFRSSRKFYSQKNWIVFIKSFIVLFSLIPIIIVYRYLLLFITLSTL